MSWWGVYYCDTPAIVVTLNTPDVNTWCWKCYRNYCVIHLIKKRWPFIRRKHKTIAVIISTIVVSDHRYGKDIKRSL